MSQPKSEEKIVSASSVDAHASVFVQSTDLSKDGTPVAGYDFNKGVDYDALFKSFASTGFQATQFAAAIDQVNRMIDWRLSDEVQGEEAKSLTDSEGQPLDPSTVKCTIFLGYTSNMISSGVREIIRFLVEHKMVSAVVTTAGGIEEDLMKAFSHHYMGDFKLPGKELRKQGLNRIGNLLVPNANYCAFEDWINPILDAMVDEQAKGTHWTPSKMIHRLGKEIDNPSSVYYWAYKNNIPVYCPAITDGSIGDMIFFHSYRKPGLALDLVEDIRSINVLAMQAKKTGMIILGGGIVKHHICNANLMRNGADFSVFINTAHEWDGSDAGAPPDEAISWGKIRLDAKPVKVSGDATFLFPLLVSQTFAKRVPRPAPSTSTSTSPATEMTESTSTSSDL